MSHSIGCRMAYGRRYWLLDGLCYIVLAVGWLVSHGIGCRMACVTYIVLAVPIPRFSLHFTRVTVKFMDWVMHHCKGSRGHILYCKRYLSTEANRKAKQSKKDNNSF